MSTQPPGSAPKLRATIRDVAALAGVGTKTVSRVINDEANVSPQTRARVERAVLALNFKPNQGAGALRRGDRKTLTLGLLLDAVDNPFSALINRAVETVAYRRDTAVLAASTDNDPDRERIMVDAFTRRRVDGLILNTITEDQGYLQAEREQGTPLVFVDRPPIGLLADAVVTNNYEAALEATQHLISHGHRRHRPPRGRAGRIDCPRADARLHRCHGQSGTDRYLTPGQRFALRTRGLRGRTRAYAARQSAHCAVYLSLPAHARCHPRPPRSSAGESHCPDWLRRHRAG